MPRRGGGKPRNWKADNEHFEHDDRTHSHTRRVSFKPGTNKGKNKFRSWNDPAKLLLDDDIDMGASGGHMNNLKTSFRGRGGRLNSPAPRSSNGLVRKKFVPGALPWYRITIPYGAKHEKHVVLKALLDYITPTGITPYYYKVNGNSAVFYVDDVNVAEKLFYADRKILMSDGFKLVILVRSGVPNENIDENMKEKMKVVMAKRYNAATKALDLTKFHADSDLVDLFCPLYRPLVMIAVIDIISENIPDLEALNLNDNKLHGIDHLRRLTVKLKNLKILYLGDNKIPHIGALDTLRPLPLTELYLKGNPLVERFNDHEIYISDVRKKFPKLTRLDGVDLPPAIGFDVAEDVTLPPSQQSFLVDPAGQELVREFLTQYFEIYDSDSRQGLLEAYHEHATMSLAANYLINDNRGSATSRLNAYITNSRNLIRITDREYRRRYLRTGKLQIVSFLSDLPKTSHFLRGFAVDLLVFTPGMIILTMNGVFKETNTPGNPMRSFHRTFIIVPNGGGGFCIMNDMLYVSNTTKEQEDKSVGSAESTVTELEEHVSPSNIAVTIVVPPQATPSLVTPTVVAPTNDAHTTLINLLSQQTGMNHNWSMNCLQETGWDPQRALFIFNQLHSEGKIPPEAFIK